MRVRLLNIFTLFVVCCLATSAGAFDGQRKGFMMDFGLGGGITSFTQTLESVFGKSESDRENKGGLLTNFRIGVGLNEQTEIYWYSTVSWFSLENILGSSVTIANGFAGIGLTQFFQPIAPSPYFFGGLGFSTWSTPFEDTGDSWFGFGMQGGAGIEFSPHWAVEGHLMWGQPKESEGGLEITAKTINFGVTLNYHAY